MDGDGPSPARIAFVAEAPAKEEMKQGRPLVGPSGDVNWQLAFRYARLERRGNYVTNWRKIPFSDFEKKHLTPEEGAEWTENLLEELAEVQPEIIIALGGYAVGALLGPEYSLYWANGVPIKRDGRVIIPVVHPAAGIHETSLLQRTAQGYAGVRAHLEGVVEPLEWSMWRGDPTTVILNDSTIPDLPTHSLTGIGIDTEGTKESPFCLTFDYGAGPRLVWDEVGACNAFAAWLDRVDWTTAHLVFHNFMYDAAVLRAMGIDVLKYPWTDTMVRAFTLQDTPMDLKGLTRRLVGMRMTEYEKVVGPWAKKADEEWKERAAQKAFEATRYEQQFTVKGKPKHDHGKEVFKLAGPETEIGLLTHLQRGQKLSPHEQAWAEAQVGKRPGLELKWVPEDIAVTYAGKDATVTRLIEPILEARQQEAGVIGAYDLDIRALPLIEDMQQVGMNIDIERYHEVLGHVTNRRLEVIDQIRTLIGKPEFNPGSSDQVAEFCAETYEKERKLGLTKKTKGGRLSTESNVLSQLKEQHPFIPLELAYRELDKYLGTYLLPMGPLIKQVGPDEWRLFANLRTTTVVTGRLSAHSPNVLAWPARTKLGLMLRSIFAARPGHVLASWDLSQIELRILAAFSGDEVMTEAFTRGLDLHSNLASKLFGVPYDRVDKASQRTPCKTIHYGLIYGAGGDTLWEEMVAMGVHAFSREDCWNLIRETWKVYRKAGLFLKEQAEEARRTGYARTFMGRRRAIPGCQLVGDRWPILSLRREAERQAGNFAIQGGAGELLKQAEIAVWERVYPEVRKAGHYFRLWLQVHDELIGETTPEAFPLVDRLMREAMTELSWLTSPIPVETESVKGSHWGELK